MLEPSVDHDADHSDRSEPFSFEYLKAHRSVERPAATRPRFRSEDRRTRPATAASPSSPSTPHRRETTPVGRRAHRDNACRPSARPTSSQATASIWIALFLYYLILGEGLSKLADTSTIPQINNKHIIPHWITLPPLQEQRKIALILRTWDDAIERLESARARKMARRTAVVYQLVFGPGAPHGTRWSQTASSWNIQRIGRVAREVSERNSGLAAEAVLTCSKHRGFVLSADYFSRSVHSADLRNYKLIANGQFGFPSNHIEEGSIGLQNVLSLGAVSPIYTVFEFDPKSVDATFAYLVLKSRPYLQMFEASTNSSVDRRGSLRWPDFSLLPFPVPPLPTQQHIATIAQDLDQEIALVSKEIDLLADQKRGLMQKLLTGDVRVNVELDQDSGRDQQ